MLDCVTESEVKKEGTKRLPAALTQACGVCSAPAPDHKHFGGRIYFC